MCYRLVGYPPGYKERKKEVFLAAHTSQFKKMSPYMYTCPTSCNTQTENIHPNMHTGFKVDCSIGKGDFQIAPHLNKAQHGQIQTMLDKEKQLECMTNMTGIDFKTLPTVEQVKWIIDTGATNHMTASLDMLFDGKTGHYYS